MIGHTISHYKITEKLGEGGMGVVYKAEDTKLKRPVALKFLRSETIEDDEHRRRFLREAQAAAALDHPNICTIYEIDEADGRTFLSMAFLEGRTVKAKLTERPLKLDEALDIAIQTTRGLQAAHQKRRGSPRHQGRQLDANAPRPSQDHGFRAGATCGALTAHQDRDHLRDTCLHVARVGEAPTH